MNPAQKQFETPEGKEPSPATQAEEMVQESLQELLDFSKKDEYKNDPDLQKRAAEFEKAVNDLKKEYQNKNRSTVAQSQRERSNLIHEIMNDVPASADIASAISAILEKYLREEQIEQGYAEAEFDTNVEGKLEQEIMKQLSVKWTDIPAYVPKNIQDEYFEYVKQSISAKIKEYHGLTDVSESELNEHIIPFLQNNIASFEKWAQENGKARKFEGYVDQKGTELQTKIDTVMDEAKKKEFSERFKLITGDNIDKKYNSYEQLSNDIDTFNERDLTNKINQLESEINTLPDTDLLAELQEAKQLEKPYSERVLHYKAVKEKVDIKKLDHHIEEIKKKINDSQQLSDEQKKSLLDQIAASSTQSFEEKKKSFDAVSQQLASQEKQTVEKKDMEQLNKDIDDAINNLLKEDLITEEDSKKYREEQEKKKTNKAELEKLKAELEKKEKEPSAYGETLRELKAFVDGSKGSPWEKLATKLFDITITIVNFLYSNASLSFLLGTPKSYISEYDMNDIGYKAKKDKDNKILGFEQMSEDELKEYQQKKEQQASSQESRENPEGKDVLEPVKTFFTELISAYPIEFEFTDDHYKKLQSDVSKTDSLNTFLNREKMPEEFSSKSSILLYYIQSFLISHPDFYANKKDLFEVFSNEEFKTKFKQWKEEQTKTP